MIAIANFLSSPEFLLPLITPQSYLAAKRCFSSMLFFGIFQYKIQNLQNLTVNLFYGTHWISYIRYLVASEAIIM